MVDGKLSATWNQTSYLMATTINSSMGNKAPVQPMQVNPYKYEERTEQELDSQLAAFFGIDMGE